MPTPTVTVNLASLDPGTIPTVTESLVLRRGETCNFEVTWPLEGADSATCELQFN